MTANEAAIIPAKLCSKAGLCSLCKFSFHDERGNLGCTQMPSGKVPKDVLTADRECREFRRREP